MCVANVYMAIFGRLRLDLKKERVQIAAEEAAVPAKQPVGASRRQVREFPAERK